MKNKATNMDFLPKNGLSLFARLRHMESFNISLRGNRVGWGKLNRSEIMFTNELV